MPKSICIRKWLITFTRFPIPYSFQTLYVSPLLSFQTDTQLPRLPDAHLYVPEAQEVVSSSPTRIFTAISHQPDLNQIEFGETS